MVDTGMLWWGGGGGKHAPTLELLRVRFVFNGTKRLFNEIF